MNTCSLPRLRRKWWNWQMRCAGRAMGCCGIRTVSRKPEAKAMTSTWPASMPPLPRPAADQPRTNRERSMGTDPLAAR